MDRQQPSQPAPLQGFLLAALAGLALGALAKMADQSSVPGLGDIGTRMGVWIAVVTVTAVTAPTRRVASVRSALMMVSMVAAYYTGTYLYFRVVTPLDIAVWGIVALTGVPALAALVWSARSSGWSASASAALPVGLLAAEAWTLRHYVSMGLHIGPFVFDVVAALLLLLLLPSTHAQRLRTGVLVVPVAIMGMWLLSVGFSCAAGVLMRAVV